MSETESRPAGGFGAALGDLAARVVAAAPAGADPGVERDFVTHALAAAAEAVKEYRPQPAGPADLAGEYRAQLRAEAMANVALALLTLKRDQPAGYAHLLAAYAAGGDEGDGEPRPAHLG